MILANKIQSDAENFKLLVRGDRFGKFGSVMRLLTDEEEEILNLFRHKYSLYSATGQNNVMKQIIEWTSSIKKARELRLHDLEELRKRKECFESMKVTTSVSVDGDANAATTKAPDEITSKQDEANLGAVGGEVSNAAEKQSMKDKSKALSKQSDREEALLQHLQYLEAKRDLPQQKLEMEMAIQRCEADEELRRLEEKLKLTKRHNELKSAYLEQVLQDFDLDIEKASSIGSAEKVRDWQMQNVLLEGHGADSCVQKRITQNEPRNSTLPANDSPGAGLCFDTVIHSKSYNNETLHHNNDRQLDQIPEGRRTLFPERDQSAYVQASSR